MKSPLVEETQYYPFGLTMSGISSKALRFGEQGNKYKFNNGTELQSGEFSDGSGLELYATEYRSLDHQLGRFWQVDPRNSPSMLALVGKSNDQKEPKVQPIVIG